jgi:HSP20 family protein
MSNGIRRRTPSEIATPTQGSQLSTWDPFQIMREMLAWDAGTPSFTTPSRGVRFAPAFDVKETADAYVFKADLPGVKEADLDIQLTGNRLTISGRRESEERREGETWYAVERSSGGFTRSFTLPEGADGEHVSAELKEGVLLLTLPKKPEVQPRRIQVSGGKSGHKA